jgi:hypothetical protein
VFDNLSNWTWVALAYAQVVLAYAGYLAYLRWRERRLRDRDEP